MALHHVVLEVSMNPVNTHIQRESNLHEHDDDMRGCVVICNGDGADK